MKLANPIIERVGRYAYGRLYDKWNKSPFGVRPIASSSEYMEIYRSAIAERYPTISNFEDTLGYAIDEEWINDLALHTQIVKKKTGICFVHGRILYTTLRSYLEGCDRKKRIVVLETGTARGFSALCMAKALDDSSQCGLIHTLDVLPHHKPMYWNCIDDRDGPRTRGELLLKWRDLTDNYILFHQADTKSNLDKIQYERINFAFLDGSHTFEDVIWEVERIEPKQRPGDIIVIDDYTPSQFPGIVRAVDIMGLRYGYKRYDIKTHHERGYVVLTKV